MDRLVQDLRLGLRSLRCAPVFTVTAVLILALGIGMATATFTVFRGVVLQELPVTDPGRLVSLWTYSDPTIPLPVDQQQVDGLRRESRTVQDAAGVIHWGTFANLVTEGDRSFTPNQALVTANFFDVLGVRPMLGRLFRPEDGEDGAAPVTVISYPMWQREFGGDPEVLGRRLTTTHDQVSYSIIGVAPRGLDYPVGADYWTLAQPFDRVNVVARLAPGITPEAARSEFLSIIQVLDRTERQTPVNPIGATVEPLTEAVLGNTRPILVALTAAVALLLLIACVNVGNLLLMRATLRARDLVIRRALGASYGRVARRLLVESTLLGVAGGVLGLGCAVVLLRVLLVLAPPQLPRMDMVDVAGTPVAAAIGVTLSAVLVFGVGPSLAAARGNLASTLRLDTRSGTGTRQRHRVRQSLVALQVALALMMLVGAGLLVRSVQRLQQLELGYETDGLSIVEVVIPFVNYDDSPEQTSGMFEEVFRRLRAVPGIAALTPVLYPPFTGASLMQAPIVLDGQSEAEVQSNPPIPVEAGGAEYFRTFRIPILRGRGFLESDRADAPRVAVVSEAVARRLWPGEDPIGKEFGVYSITNRWTVVGIAGDIRYRRLREPTPTIYLPWRQLTTFGVVAVRTDIDFAAALPAMRQTVRDFDSQSDVRKAGTIDDYLGGPLSQPRLSALLLSSFGTIAVLLAAIGLYGVMALAVRERTHDLGVRAALGATPARLRRDVLRDALAVTTVGAVAGLGGALVGSRLLAALLFEVSPVDPVTLVGVSAVFPAVAAIAAYFPARRATRVDPVQALRAD
ncbi:MAG: FtsX-like permease family protein [Gemmatimonas sp.]|nr:FtsX-like permease family protein [Gemmatimonas sp.]